MLYKLGELGQTDKDTNQMISLNCGIAETNKKKANKQDRHGLRYREHFEGFWVGEKLGGWVRGEVIKKHKLAVTE